jgi:hypothetical protein
VIRDKPGRPFLSVSARDNAVFYFSQPLNRISRCARQDGTARRIHGKAMPVSN